MTLVTGPPAMMSSHMIPVASPKVLWYVNCRDTGQSSESHLLTLHIFIHIYRYIFPSTKCQGKKIIWHNGFVFTCDSCPLLCPQLVLHRASCGPEGWGFVGGAAGWVSARDCHSRLVGDETSYFCCVTVLISLLSAWMTHMNMSFSIVCILQYNCQLPEWR